METRPVFLVSFILILLVLLAACSPGSSNETPAATSKLDGATLVQERCSVCHPVSVVSTNSYTADQWKSLVDQMIQRGAQLTPDEETEVVNFLAANYGK